MTPESEGAPTGETVTAPAEGAEQSGAVAGTGEVSGEGLVTKGEFQFEVAYKDDASQEDKDASLDWIKECTAALAGDDVSVPQCVAAFTVRRVN